MATDTKQSSGVQELIDRLRDEGVSAGQSEADGLLTEALFKLHLSQGVIFSDGLIGHIVLYVSYSQSLAQLQINRKARYHLLKQLQ